MSASVDLTALPTDSYARFSTPQQKEGDSTRRQIEAARAYCADRGWRIPNEMLDEGLSAYHGKHLGPAGHLGRYLTAVKDGALPVPRILIVEALDRLSRQTPRLAFEQYLSLVNAGVHVVTLFDGHHHTQASIDGNAGTLHATLAVMQAAHLESKNKAERVRASWGARKVPGSAANKLPSWIVKTANGAVVDRVKGVPAAARGIAIDESKAATIRRIFALILDHGSTEIARMLNAEGIPGLTKGRAWDSSAILQVVRSRNALGGVWPAVIDEKTWLEAQGALDRRQRGGKGGAMRGHNANTMVNLFGALARCAECDARMNVRHDRHTKRGKTYEYVSLRCPEGLVRACGNRRLFAVPKIEARMAEAFAKLVPAPRAMSRPRVDPVVTLKARIATAKGDAERMQRSVVRMAGAVGDNESLMDAMHTIAAQRKAKLAEIVKLEAELVELSAPGVDIATAQGLWQGLEGLKGDARIEARRHIANVLPTILDMLECRADGLVIARLRDRWALTNNGRLLQRAAEWWDDAGPVHRRQGVKKSKERRGGNVFERAAREMLG